MTNKQAARILDPETSREALAPYAHDCQLRLAVTEEACTVAAKVLRDTAWISVKDRLPKNEKDVLIAYTLKGLHGDVYSRVCMAFHTDGKTNIDDSAYSWQTEYIDMDYDEESDAYIIPEGWWETVDFGETFSAVDMVVTHWMPMPELPKEY